MSVQPRQFVLYSLGNGISQIGTWMQKFGVGWLVWDLTHSPGWVGAVALCDLIAALAVTPLAGVVADRSNPYRLLTITQLSACLQAVGLSVLTALGADSVAAVFVMVAALSVIEAFNQPTRMGVVTRLASRERLSQAIATNSITMNLARAIGPAIAGIMVTHGGVPLIFVANALSFIVFLATLRVLRPHLSVPPEARGSHFFADAAAGIRYVARTPALTTFFLGLVSIGVLARPFGELLPAISGAVFHGTPQTLALFHTAQGVGALMGAAWMLQRCSGQMVVRRTFFMGLGLSAGLLIFVATDHLAVAVPAMVAIGLFHVVCTIGSQSMLQLMVEPVYRGRVLAVFGVIFRGGPNLGAFALGLAAEQFGLRPMVALGALAAAAILVLIAAGFREKLLTQVEAG